MHCTSSITLLAAIRAINDSYSLDNWSSIGLRTCSLVQGTRKLSSVAAVAVLVADAKPYLCITTATRTAAAAAALKVQ